MYKIVLLFAFAAATLALPAGDKHIELLNKLEERVAQLEDVSTLMADTDRGVQFPYIPENPNPFNNFVSPWKYKYDRNGNLVPIPNRTSS